MNLALVLGQNSDSLKPKLISVKDNLNIECFTGLKQFVNISIKRELLFDRIIIISKLVKDDSYIDELYNFWNTHNRDSEIVFLCKKEIDTELARKFLSKFLSTNVACMLVPSVPLTILSEAVTLPISTITETYGIQDYLTVEVEDDEEPNIQEEETDVQVEEDVSTEDTQENKPKEKRTLFGALFGRGKNKKGKEKPKKSNTSTDNQDTTPTVEGNQSIAQEEPLNNQSSPYAEEVDDTADFNGSLYQDDSSSMPDTVENNQFNSEILEENTSEFSSDNEEDFDDSFSQEGTISEGYPSDTIDEQYEDEYSVQAQDEYDTQQEYEDEYDNQQSYGDEYETQPSQQAYEDEYSDNYSYEEDEQYQSVDDDFGDLTYSDDTPQEQVQEQSGVSYQEVGDVDDLTLGYAEEEYRQKTETPKVVKETVVKEVIKTVKTSSVLQNVYKGIAHKSIIVTGDRGSGVTTLAWSLALHFSKKVPVLYFDCDVVTHGLMNYIDYFDFKNYEECHMKGVKLCRSSSAFKNCVCKWNTNIDLLTSDFGVDVSDDELMYSQGIVAENLSEYGVVIVDCPISKLHCVQDLILTGSVAVCIEDTKRGYMNALTALDASELSLRYKRNIVSRGTIIRTKVNRKNDYKRVLSYINSIVDFDECNWLNMEKKEFSGKVTNDLLTQILEG